MENFEIRGSQWVLSRILRLELNINRYTSLRGRSYVPLLDVLANKKAINVKNKDKCFLWAILSALHPVNKDAQRVCKYQKYENEFDKALKGIEFPVKLTDVSNYEENNQQNALI
jgi:hypothetical protein